MSNQQISIDHKGIEYESQKAMCDAYKIEPSLFVKRVSRGWTVEEALCGKPPIFSRDGVDYYNKEEICTAFNIHPNTYYTKLKQGYSIDEIVDKKTYRTSDHLGNKYKNKEEMCIEYGINVATFRRRMEVYGMSLEEALTKKLHHERKTKEKDNE